MTNAKLKNRVQISSSVDPELWDKMQKISKKTDVPLARLLDRAMDLYIKKEAEKR